MNFLTGNYFPENAGDPLNKRTDKINEWYDDLGSVEEGYTPPPPKGIVDQLLDDLGGTIVSRPDAGAALSTGQMAFGGGFPLGTALLPKSVTGSNKDPYRDDRMENRPSFAAVFGEEQQQKSDELIETAAEDWASRFSREGNTNFYEQQKANRKKFLGRSNMIFFQTIALDLLAQHTGTKSYAEAFARSAMADLDAAQKTAEEDTMAAAMEALYFRPDGTYDPPKTQQEAFEALTRMGVDPISASSITGNVVEQADKKYGWVDSTGKLRVTKQPPKDHEYTELTNAQAAQFISSNKVTPVKATDKVRNATYYASVQSEHDSLPDGHPKKKYLKDIMEFMGPTDHSKFNPGNITSYKRLMKDVFDRNYFNEFFLEDEFKKHFGIPEDQEVPYFKALDHFTNMMGMEHGFPVRYGNGSYARFKDFDDAEKAIAEGILTPSSGEIIIINGNKHKNPTIQ